MQRAVSGDYVCNGSNERTEKYHENGGDYHERAEDYNGRAGDYHERAKSLKEDLKVLQMNSVGEKAQDDSKNEKSSMLAHKAEMYTTAIGSYVTWNCDVDLGPPRKDIPVPAEDSVIHKYYTALQYTLFETGYPETVDRTSTPISNMSKDRVAVAVLSSPEKCMAILQEGGVQCPGDMLLILSTTWLTKEKSSLRSGTYSLMVHKAITFDTAGRTFLDLYSPPRRVTYFINFFTRACTCGARNDGEKLEVGLDCPMSSSLALCKMIGDKLWTRIMMANAGLVFPETLAFTYCGTLPYETESPDITIVSLDTKVGVENLMLEEIQKFVASPRMQKYDMIVVKPSGVIQHDSAGVTFHQKDDVVSIGKAAQDLLEQMEEENAVLVETFCNTISPSNPSGLKWGCSDAHSCRVRTIAVRGPDNKPHMTKVVCGVGLKKDPVNGDNTIPQSLDTTLLSFSVTDPVKRSSIRENIKVAAERLFQHIIDYEQRLSEVARGGSGAQSDLISIDYILTESDGNIVPVGIGVNSHDCTTNRYMSEYLYPESRGEAFKTFVQTIVLRSQRFLMRGKRVLVIGAGGCSKAFIWPTARDYGINIILVDNNPDHMAAEMVEAFISYDLTDHNQDEIHARNIIHLVKQKGLPADGCITFLEDYVPLTAHIHEMLNLVGTSLSGALVAKKKSLTQRVLQECTGIIPHFPRTCLYASRTYHISSSTDIYEAATKMEFPCVMKLEYGVAAVCATLVNDVTQCHKEWGTVQEVQTEMSCPANGLGYGKTMLLMDYISGTEHDVDIIIYKRNLIGAFVSDNGPTRLPKFTETAAAMPSYLPSEKRRQLIISAYQCCVEAGLESGVFNVELKLTTTGPKLIEINARMGGYKTRGWISKLYSVDMLFCAFMIACDIKPILPQVVPAGQMVGAMVVPSAHREALTNPTNMKLLHLLEINGMIHVNRLTEVLPPEDQDRFEVVFMNIAVLDKDPETATTKLIEVFNLLGMNSKEYPVEEFLKDFRKF